MWLLRLKGGIEITESTVQCWDNVPYDVEIESLALAIPRQSDARPFIFDFPRYEEYCCARIASDAGDGQATMMGYCVYAATGDRVVEMLILASGVTVKSYGREKSDVPDRCWRRGVR